MDLAILTPIEVEFRTIKARLTGVKAGDDIGLPHATGYFQGKSHRYSIVLLLCGSKNTDIALATEKTVQHWQPAMVWLMGVAGGVKDVRIGDVVVGTKAYGYESGKETAAGFVARPEVYLYHSGLLGQARSIALADRWQQQLPVQDFAPKVVFGPIASGDKVIASTDSPIYRLLKQHYNDTVALEMESIGFAKAMAAHPQIPAANIRGVSDLLDDKRLSDAEGGQDLAMDHVAAFVFELLHQLDFPKLKMHYTMDVNKLAQQIVGLLFPLLKLESIKQIGKEFKEATDTTIEEIWEKVRPIFIEEIEAEERPEEAQVAIRTSLRKELNKDEALRKELIGLLQQAEEKALTGGGNVSISHSKNVIQGSDIRVGGDFRMGDEVKTTDQKIEESGIISNHGKVVLKGKNVAGGDLTINS